jgi:glycogen operon protein
MARNDNDFDPRSAFLAAVAQDPTLAKTKLIAEPWDVAAGGYQVGGFPRRWSEWNGRFRDTVRDYWRSQPGTLSDLATRIMGSADLYEHNGRTPASSVNLVTAHDGFTLRDLVSYNEKHNDANLEENRDGTNDNRAWNLGVEGATDDPAINATRARQARNLLATLILSHGVPMIVAGDELGRTQGGNNNAYCQDNELSWIHWDDMDQALVRFTRRLIDLRRKHGAFQRRRWTPPRTLKRSLSSIAWFSPSGQEMTLHRWQDAERRAVGLYLEDQMAARGRGRRQRFDRFYLMFNAHLEEVTFKLPSPRWGTLWHPVLDTADDHIGSTTAGVPSYARATIVRPSLSLLVLRCPRR